MFGIRPLWAGAAALLASACAYPTEIPIVFTVVESVRTFTESYSTGNTDSQRILHTGSMDAVLNFDPATQRPTAIRFTGGVLHESDSSLKNTANINFYGVGTKPVSFEKHRSALQMRINTIGAPHPISSDGRVLNTERLQSYPISGRLTAKLTIDGRSQTRTIDVATNPPDSVDSNMGTEIRLQLTETKNHGATSDYKISFYSHLQASQSERIPNTDTTVTSSTEGFTLAEAEFSTTNGFGQWLLHHGFQLDDAPAVNRNGIPLALLYSFSLPPSEHAFSPWSFSHESGTPIPTLHLPEQGLQQAIQIECCDDLALGKWRTLNEQEFLAPDTGLGPGAKGLRRIRSPDSGPIFYRILPAE